MTELCQFQNHPILCVDCRPCLTTFLEELLFTRLPNASIELVKALGVCDAGISNFESMLEFVRDEAGDDQRRQIVAYRRKQESMRAADRDVMLKASGMTPAVAVTRRDPYNHVMLS